MISIEKFHGRLSGVVDLTASKSITNRALIIRALSENDFKINNKATAGDSLILEKALRIKSGVIDVQDAGTAFRFLAAYLSCIPGNYLLTGTDRMKQRPIGSLVDSLISIGADIHYESVPHFPPLKISGKLLDGGEVSVDASMSSQYVSALLLIAPVLKNGLTIRMTGKISSRPYIGITIELMRHFGIKIDEHENVLTISRQQYLPKDFKVENDWSAASFWYIMAAMSESAELILKGLFENSIQGDMVIIEIMNKFGIETRFLEDGIVIKKNERSVLPTSFKYDFYSCPDLVIPIAVLCAALQIPGEFRGVKNLRIKESDRLAALEEELRKIGSEVTSEEDIIIIKPISGLKIIESIRSHNDHRIAMAFASLAIKMKMEIEDHTVVGKSYPEFWGQIRDLGFVLR